MTEQARRVIAFTITTDGGLPAARVLAKSYLAHHPAHRFVIAVLDGEDGQRTEGDYGILGPDKFGLDRDDYLRLATAYQPAELAAAVKPFLLRSLRAQAGVVTYLAPTIQVLAPFDEVVELANEHATVLTPHFLAPLPPGRHEDDPEKMIVGPSALTLIGAGVLNPGFISVGPGSEPLLDLWTEATLRQAVVELGRQPFADQAWIDQNCGLFPHLVLRDKGFNVGCWNTFQRPITSTEDDTYLAGSDVLRFINFYGYRPEKPWLLNEYSVYQPRTLLSDHPALAGLCDGYRAELLKAGHYLDPDPAGFYRQDTEEPAPSWLEELPDGTSLNPLLRELFRAEWAKAIRQAIEPPPHGFASGNDAVGARFREWLASPGTPAEAGAGLNRWVMAIWRGRPDLQQAWPWPASKHAEAFRKWCRESAIEECDLASWALPEEPATPREPDERFGANILGPLTAEMGIGQLSRMLHDAIVEARVPVVSVVEDRLINNRTGLDRPETRGAPRFPLSVLCVNADFTRQVIEAYPEIAHERYRIGVWSWELKQFPPAMHDAFDLVDEVWTVSEFCREAIAKHTSKPLKTIPLPVTDPGEPHRSRRAPGDPVRFLFVMDFNSVAERKNPWGTVEAFRGAFLDRDDVRLAIKVINSDRHIAAAERLRTVVADDPRITLIDHYLSASEMDDLYNRSDCYVSLHRSEGFGFTVAEAMARGLPVIVTNYSGNTEFLDPHSCWPIPRGMVEVGKGWPPYPEQALWASPDLEAAAAAMREVADNPEDAAARGRRAREYILRTRDASTTVSWVGEQLKEAFENWRQARSAQPEPASGPAPVESGVDPLVALRAAREALRWRPDVDAPSRMPALTPVLRKAVLRAIDHYDVHQRHVLGALMDGVEDSLVQVLAKLDAVESKLGRKNQRSDEGQ